MKPNIKNHNNTKRVLKARRTVVVFNKHVAEAYEVLHERAHLVSCDVPVALRVPDVEAD